MKHLTSNHRIISARYDSNAARAQLTIKEVAAVFPVFLIVIVVFTWPLAGEFAHSIPAGSEPPTLCLFQLFTMEWSVKAWRHGLPYWNAPMFHPYEGTFAWSEPQPLSAAAFWIMNSCGAGSATAYNILIILYLSLAGISAYVLSRLLTSDRLAAIASGAWFAIGAYNAHQLGALHLVATGFPAMTVFLIAVMARGRATWRQAGALALMYAATWLTCAQYGLFLTLLLPLAGIGFFTWDRTGIRRLSRASAGLLAGGAAIAPYLLAQHQRLMTMGFHRPLSEVNGVFHLKDLLLPARGHWLTGRVLGFDVRTDIYSWDLGLVFIALILVQCALSGKSRWRVRMFSAGTARGLTLMGAVALLLGFGPRLGITLDGEPVGPYALLSLIVPGLDGIRSPARLALFSTLAVSSVGAAAYAGLRSRVNRPLARMAFTFGVIVCLAAEMVTMPIPLTSAALESPGVKQAVDWLRLTEDRAPVVELPLAQSGIPADLEPEVRAMRRALLHGHPVVNGYSGHFPETFWQIGLATIQDPAGSGARYLQALGVRYVLVAHPAAPQTWRDSWRATSLRHWQFAGGVTIYELAAVPQPESVEVDTQMKLRQPPEPGMMISIKLTRPATTAALASPPASRRISIAWETRPHYWETIEVQCSGQVLADAGARVVYVELIELPGWFGDGRARLVSAERVRHVQQRRATPNPY